MKIEKAYQTNIVIALGFLALGIYFKMNFLLYIPLLVLGLSVLNRSLALWIARTWMFFGEQMGVVSGFILLSLVFYLFLVLLAFLKKLIEEKSSSKASNWKELNQSITKESFFKAW